MSTIERAAKEKHWNKLPGCSRAMLDHTSASALVLPRDRAAAVQQPFL
jgi:hypothetical protein